MGLEVSRLARNNHDWYQLLDLCGLLNTLIIDAEGIYDPRQLNDRLLLGLKGTMSEAELGWLRQRAHEASGSTSVDIDIVDPQVRPIEPLLEIGQRNALDIFLSS